jgi:HK97 family phage portal protein
MGLTDIFQRLLKAQTSPQRWLDSSVAVMAGSGGGARAPFRQDLGIRSFRSWVYAAAQINANAVAANPIRLYVKAGEAPVVSRAVPKHRKAYLFGDGLSDQRPSMSVLRRAASYGDDLEEVSGGHPILDVLSSANPFLNGYDLTVLRILYGELTGNAYLHPVLDAEGQYPVELWPLGSQYVEVVPDEERFIRGYVYGIDSQHKNTFTPDEVIHFRRPNPGSLYYGLGKVEAAWGAVQANEAIHEMDLATFANQARPDYAVVVKGNPTGDQLDRFQYQVQERLRGSRKDGNFITVTGDVQFTPLNFPPKDLAGREDIVEEIAAVFGVPVSMLKANDPNLASATSGFAQWREGTVLPLCRMDEEELNQSLLPLFGLDERYCLAYDNPVPRDRQMELTERQTAVAGGWRTPNEARLEEGREPIDDPMADRLLVNGQPLGGPAPLAGGFMSVDDAGGQQIDPAASVGSVEDAPVEEAKSEDAAVARPSEGPVLTSSVVSSVVDVLAAVAEGNLSPIAAIEVLVGCGFDREIATRMVETERKRVEGVQATELPRVSPEMDLGAILQSAKDGTLGGYSAVKLLQASGWTRRQAERAIGMVSKVERLPGEPLDDCIERALEVLLAEGYDQQQALAIAHSQCGESKAIEDVDLQPTEEMAALAERGLALREEHGRGGTEVGVARARDIKNRTNLSPETVARMANYFSRHRVDLDVPAADSDHEDYPSAGVVAWLLWGGDPANPDGAGAGWAERKLEELDAAREKASGCGCCTKAMSGSVRPVYEWPEETRMARLAIEGLDDDFARLTPKAAEDTGGDAEDAIREGERTTPAKRMASAVAKSLDAVYAEILSAFKSGKIKPSPAKSFDDVAEKIIKSLKGDKAALIEALMEATESAARGGRKVGLDRLNEILSEEGAGRVPMPRITQALLKSIAKRVELVAESVVDETIKAFLNRTNADFNIDDEIKRVQQARDVSRSRAETIARTESAAAYHEGQIDTWKATGRVKKKRFLMAPLACPLCEAIDKKYGRGGERLDIAEPMVKAGSTITGTDGKAYAVGRDSQGTIHPNCRCDMRPILED